MSVDSLFDDFVLGDFVSLLRGGSSVSFAFLLEAIPAAGMSPTAGMRLSDYLFS